ncbi:hypothetical protein OIU77_000014 [Salix suchowensis]|uniref:Uncharacterized protein n=1 Tax=Salix suchowensis TaxID=1278906 RepID=A0ABQ9B7I9_9ROSI|nr:hypothetical protein OIU77_000014 [Salix suchowensis]
MVYLQGSKLLSRVMVTVYPKQELLNQHKAVLPVLNSGLRGSTTGEVTSLGNIQPASWKLERPTRTMHEAQAANNIRRKRHFGEICTDKDALVGCSKKELQCLDFSQNSKRSNMIKEDSKASPNLILLYKSFVLHGVLDVKQKLRKFELDMSKLRQSKLRWRKMESPIYSHILWLVPIYHLIKLSPDGLGLQIGVLPTYMDLQDFPSVF